jgi:hypothetical protein
VVDISSILQIVKMGRLATEQPIEAQWEMFAAGVEMFGSKFLRVNEAQAKLIAEFMRNKKNLSEVAGVQEDEVQKFAAAFAEAASAQAPIRIICKSCNTLNTLGV